MATELKPLNDRIVIKPLQQEQVLSSGIVIPDSAKEKPQQGEVIAIGPGKRDDDGNRVPLDIEMGDRILYKKYTGQEIQIDNEDLIVLEEREVLAKLIV
ncbi:MAG: co-chaperone GroES [Chloroflexota bacterium]|jgi:chaperonin GroES|nr:co-chaperone GroES [Chloroflexota bacterium]MCY3587706.1 co-chaperone GroES [Chloroflexota bacterium]MCY3923016.1 co-chaperone GroES [Chloroflexota bacterium]MDE2707866.1 co-chaperone GroES [Chloroflexota bacterium]MDE2746475.1 co-chaperone GroES [Chloroflexota bacterium]